MAERAPALNKAMLDVLCLIAAGEPRRMVWQQKAEPCWPDAMWWGGVRGPNQPPVPPNPPKRTVKALIRRGLVQSLGERAMPSSRPGAIEAIQEQLGVEPNGDAGLPSVVVLGLTPEGRALAERHPFKIGAWRTVIADHDIEMRAAWRARIERSHARRNRHEFKPAEGKQNG